MMSHKQIIGYHIIITCYGFWLPNGPRGSGSDEVRADWLRPFGKATRTDSKHSAAHLAQTPQQRKMMRQAKQVLKHTPVILTGQQALTAIRGFTQAVKEIDIYACAIMPEHIHIVTGVLKGVDEFVRLLKDSADNALHLAQQFPEHTSLSADPRTTIWGESYWKRFLYDDEDILRTIYYVEQNPIKEGKKPQHWTFVKNFP